MASLTTDRAWPFFVLLQDFFFQKNPCSVARQIVFLCVAILLSTTATSFPVSRGSSSLSIQLLPRRVAVAAGAACWAPSAQAPGHTEGSVTTVSCPHALKEMVHLHFNG